MDDPAKEFFLFLFLFLAVIVGLIWGGIALDRSSCTSKWQQAGFEADYGPLKGCLIKVNGAWLPADQYIVNAPTK